MATAHAAIASLPCELLIEIFIACACADPLSPLILEQVCRQWTEVANTTPHVWQHISLDDWKCSLPMLHMQTDRWLRRSSPLPFDVHIHLFAIDNLLPLLAPFLPYINRWRSISITGAREESVSLRDLHIESLDYLIIGIEADPKQTFATASPLAQGSSSMEVGLTSLPTTNTISNLNFTTISIIEHSVEAQSTPTSLINFLSTCPNLQSFSFMGYIHTEETYQPSLHNVRLPFLRTLCIKNTHLTRALLSAIDAPLLEELCLSLLNVDVDLVPDAPSEDGDSDDEHHDFSLSPSSDLATGMGLRRFLARSHPPIRRLDMNFSDMRTKDFTWVFRRLTELEEFSIVASDMSNTVVRLFATHLPRLKRLELYNCHRFQGDVLVESMRKRAERIERLVVSECDGVTFEHTSRLRMD
ncbi:hypothetical protein CYLTODRAFT_390247 [Cylindrobasidium torrendii FP15055 ss-10]|uniref:F-box domain-containing protein n=1 Tax=Cylindrobasidium torrendii FP15055 ss-10 TaxID=1314674 RepID=A0A0D7BMZ9_9AGAR|nr:hypothetical protein CYLTODRAFT_390247 [Cylindrobasidium torrendii FP15055 ss-10]